MGVAPPSGSWPMVVMRAMTAVRTMSSVIPVIIVEVMMVMAVRTPSSPRPAYWRMIVPITVVDDNGRRRRSPSR